MLLGALTFFFLVFVGTAGTGFFYTTSKNPRNVPRKLALMKVNSD
jgi:ribosomal protein L33